jgi:hypothetical protein
MAATVRMVANSPQPVWQGLLTADLANLAPPVAAGHCPRQGGRGGPSPALQSTLFPLIRNADPWPPSWRPHSRWLAANFFITTHYIASSYLVTADLTANWPGVPGHAAWRYLTPAAAGAMPNQLYSGSPPSRLTRLTRGA